ncbi:MAG: glycosyltransferase family 39 protein [candidate division WOR-3 bacterium]|nr:glycosyltransferase family 39 protein [candidate division WOR-3 bacterium]
MSKPKRPTSATERTRDPGRVWLFVALALTFLVRLWFVLNMRGQPFSFIGPQYVDSYFYHRWAVEIISGNFWGSDVFFLRPLYPYLLAILYSIFGQHILPVQLFQTLLATASCFFLYDTTRRMFGSRPALFAAVGFALTGILVLYTGTLLYVEITIFLSLLSLWLVLIAGNRLWLWILTGVSFGLLVICRPEMLAVLPFLLLWLWRKSPVPRPTSPVPRSGLLIMTAVAFAVIAVVPVRNYIVARDPVLFTAHSGINFYYGNNPAADGTWQPTRELEKGAGFSHERLKQISRLIEGREVKPSQASAYWTNKGLKFITSQPLAYLRLEARKLLLFLSNYEVPNDYYPETARAASVPLKLAFVNFGLVLALGLAGMFFAWPRRRQALPAYLFVAAYLLSSLVFYVLSRLRAPVFPFLLMFAGYGLSELPEALRKWKSARTAIGLAVAVAVSVGANLIPLQTKTYSAQAWTQMGNIYLTMHKPGPAVNAFNRALVALPNYYYARYCLVLGLAGMGRTADAEAEYRDLERAVGGSAETGNVERLAAARTAIAQSAGSDDPFRSQALRLASARLAIARRDFATAESLYRASLAEDSTDAETNYLLGLVYVSTNNLPAARERLARAVALDPGHDAARSALKAVESKLQR